MSQVRQFRDVRPEAPSPLAGLAASFAAVAAVFSVNIFVKPLDGILVGITNDAIHILDPSRSIGLTSNLWFPSPRSSCSPWSSR